MNIASKLSLRLVAIPALQYVATSVASVSTVLIIVRVGGDVADYGIANLLFNMFNALFAAIWPSILAGVERRLVLSIAYACLSIAYGSLYLARSVAAVWIVQMFVGIFTALIPLTQTSIFVEIFGGRSRGITVMCISMGLGWSLGLSIASVARRLLDVFLIVLLLAAVPVAINAVLVLTLPKTLGVIEAHRVIALRKSFVMIVERARKIVTFEVPLKLPRFTSVRKLKPVELYLLTCIMVFISIATFFTTLPVYLKKIVGVDDSTMYLYSMCAGISSTISYILQLRISDNLEKMLKAHILALSTRTILFSLPLLLDGFVQGYFVLYALFGATWAFIGGAQSIIVYNLSEPHRRDERVSHLNACVSLGLIAGNILAAVLKSTYGYELCFAISSLLMLAAVCLILRVKRRSLAM